MTSAPTINHILLITITLYSLIAGTYSFELPDSHKLVLNIPSQL